MYVHKLLLWLPLKFNHTSQHCHAGTSYYSVDSLHNSSLPMFSYYSLALVCIRFDGCAKMKHLAGRLVCDHLESLAIGCGIINICPVKLGVSGESQVKCAE